jgi:uncharacterized protein YuzE
VKIESDPRPTRSTFSASEVAPFDNTVIEDGVSVNIDERQRVVGLEILDASKRLSPAELSNITTEEARFVPSKP